MFYTHARTHTQRAFKWFIRACSVTFLFALLQHTVIAQDTIDDLSIRLTPYTYLDRISYENQCYPIWKINHLDMIRHSSTASVRLSLEQMPGTTITQALGYREKGTERGLITLPPEALTDETITNSEVDGTGTVIVLPLDKTFEFVGNNSCGDPMVIGEISTSRDYAQIVEVDQAIFDAVMNWNEEADGRDLYEVITQLSNVDNFRKTAFLQEFLKAKHLPFNWRLDNLPNRDQFEPKDDSSQNPDNTKNTCQCRVMQIAVSNEMEPLADGSEFGTNIIPVTGRDQTTFPRNRGRIKWDYSHAGPSRFQNLDGRTRRCRNHTHGKEWIGFDIEGNEDELAEEAPLYYASLVLGQACFDGDWQPKNCSCTNTVVASWRYRSQVVAKAYPQGGRACFNRGREAEAAADDIAFVTISDDNRLTGDGLFEILDFDRGTAISQCGRDFNEDKLLSAIKLGFNIVALAKGIPSIQGLDPIVKEVLKEVYNQYYKEETLGALASYLSDGRWMEEFGECDRADKTANNTLNNSYTFTLNGKERKRITLGASTYLFVSGITHWEATARITSGFRLNAVLEQNFSDKEEDICCTPSVATYLVHSHLGEVGGPSTSNLQAQIGSFLNRGGANFFDVLPFDRPSGSFIISGNRDIVTGKLSEDCKTRINDKRRQIPEEVLNVSSNGTLLNTIEGVFYLDNTLSVDEQIDYQVFNLQGQLITQGQGQGPRSRLHPLPLAGVPSGMYIYRLRINNQDLTFKNILP